jgi:hypothetical protein
MNYKVAILITTFLRDNLLYKTLQTIVDNYTKDCIVLIADQGYSNGEKDITIDYYKSQIPLEYYKLPFDCGAYTARNYLVRIANEKNIPSVLITADSIQFMQSYDFQPILNFLEQQDKTALTGFELENSKCPWEFLMELTPTGFKFSYSDEWTKFEDIKYLRIDICRNIYLAKTKVLLDCPYDEELKLGGHELNFWNLKQKDYKCYWTDYYTFKRISGRNNEEYETYRKRLQDYLKIVKQKLGISGWVIYPKNWKKP